MSSKVEVAMLRKVDRCHTAAPCAHLERQHVPLQRVASGDVDLAGISLLPVQAEEGEFQAVPDPLALPHSLVVTDAAAMQVIRSVVTVQLILHSSHRHHTLLDPVGHSPHYPSEVVGVLQVA
eukprot:765112-Hanusia_phi.AAC.7